MFLQQGLVEIHFVDRLEHLLPQLLYHQDLRLSLGGDSTQGSDSLQLVKPTARIIGLASCVFASFLATAACERSQEPKGYGFVSHVEPVRRPPSKSRIEDGSLAVRGDQAKQSWATRPGEVLEIEVPLLSPARFEVSVASLDEDVSRVGVVETGHVARGR